VDMCRIGASFTGRPFFTTDRQTDRQTDRHTHCNTPQRYQGRVQVTGIVRDANDTERYLMTGLWDDRLEVVKVLDISKRSHQQNVVYNTTAPIVLWQRQYPPYVTMTTFPFLYTPWAIKTYRFILDHYSRIS